MKGREIRSDVFLARRICSKTPITGLVFADADRRPLSVGPSFGPSAARVPHTAHGILYDTVNSVMTNVYCLSNRKRVIISLTSR